MPQKLAQLEATMVVRILNHANAKNMFRVLASAAKTQLAISSVLKIAQTLITAQSALQVLTVALTQQPPILVLTIITSQQI
jgi:hypothetical protein